MIRRATEDDIPRLVEMGKQFAAFSPYPTEYSPVATSALISHLIVNGIVWVNEDDGVVDGVIMGLVSCPWYGGTLGATELAFWIDPAKRGRGAAVQLLRAFEDSAKSMGAKYIAVSDFKIGDSFPAGFFFGANGYRVIERSHIKEI